MAVELATAYVNIVPSARGFARALRRQISGDVTSAGNDAGASASESFTSSFKAGLGSLGKVAAGAVAGVGAALAGVGTFGLRIAADNEQAQISFETMLGSAERAGAFLTDLKDFAASTPFEFPELQTAASSLISTGIAADKVIPIMTTLGDVTSGMGTGAEGVRRATVALQQMNAAGRITAEDLNQLRDAGIPVFDLLTGATGKTTEELAAMAQNGKLGRQELEQLMAALETGKGLERFGGLMEKQSRSLAGLISSLKDRVGQGLAEAMAPVIPQLKAMLPGITDAIGAATGIIAPVIGDVIGALVPVFQALLPLVTPVLASLGALFVSTIKPITPVIERLAAPLATFATTLANALNGALDDVLPALGQLLIALTPLLGPIARLAATVGRVLADAFVALATALAPIVETAAQHLAQLAPLFAAMAPAFAPLADALGQLAPIVPAIVAAFAALVPALGPLVDAFAELAPIAVDLVTVFAAALVPVLDELAPLLPALVAGFVPLVPIVGDLLRAIAPLVPVLVDLGGDALVAVVGAVIALSPELVKLAAAAVPLVETFAGLIGAVAESDARFVALAITIAALNWSAVTAGMSAVVGGAKGIAGAVSGASSALSIIGQVAATQGVSSFRAFAGILGESIKQTRIFTVAQGIFNAVMAINPIILIGAAIVAAIAGLVLLYQKWQPFHDLVDATGRALASAFGWIKDLVATVVSGDFSRAGEMLSNLGKTISEALGAALGKAGEVLSNLGGWLAEHVPGWVASLWETIQRVVPAALAGLGSLLGTAFAAAWSWLSDHWTDIAKGLFLMLTFLPRTIGTAIVNLGPKLLGFLATAFAWAAARAVDVAKGLLGFIASLPGRWLNALAAGISFVATFLVDAVGWAITELPGIVAGLVSFWWSLPGRLIAGLTAFGSFLLDNVFVPAFTWLVDRGPDLIAGLIGFYLSIPGRLVGALASLGAMIFDAAKAAFAWVVERGPTIIAGLVDFFAGLPGRLFDAVKDAVGAVGGAAADLGKTIWNALADFANDKLIRPIREFKVTIGVAEYTPFEGLPEFVKLAAGGPLAAGQPAIVGERGPELWWPRNAGTVVPLNPTAAPAPAAGLTIGTLNVTGQARPAETAFTLRSELRWLAATALTS